jgi:hypothetical protein
LIKIKKEYNFKDDAKAKMELNAVVDSNFFNGNIGQVRAYNTVLSTANILTIYTAGKQRYGL